MNGRIPYVDSNNPDAWGRCDKTGLPVMYSDLRPQMEYIGNVLQWTGLMVNEKDLDEPNPQLIPPRLKPDPVPVRNPRYFPLPRQPGIPTGLKVNPKIQIPITQTTLSLVWDPVVSTPGQNTGTATNYAVYWQSVNGFQNSTLPLKGPAEMTNPLYQITGLQPGTTYFIQVASINNVGYQTSFTGASPEEKETSKILTYTLSSPSYGPPTNTYSGREVENPYAALFLTTLHP